MGATQESTPPPFAKDALLCLVGRYSVICLEIDRAELTKTFFLLKKRDAHWATFVYVSDYSWKENWSNKQN